ncbi:hypothetical protein ACHAWF_004851 [Thalassiosira exigua]
MVAVCLCNKSSKSIEIEFTIRIKLRLCDREFVTLWNVEVFIPDEKNNGDDDFAERSKVMRALEHGTLTVDIQMRPGKSTDTPYVPNNPIGKNILNIFMDGDSADVMFEVVAGNDPCAPKKAKLSPVDFPAHRLILQQCAPALADMSGKGGKVQITGIKPDIFRHVLYYAYGGKVADEDMNSNAKDIIDAADKYGVAGLKLEAEASYVKSTEIRLENMMDNLLYADGKNCALLKEAVIDFLVEHGEEVLEKVSLKDFPGHMVADVLTAMTRNKEKGGTAGDGGVKLSTMRVSELRKKLDEKGLDVDGSRESMINSLKEHSSKDVGDND